MPNVYGLDQYAKSLESNEWIKLNLITIMIEMIFIQNHISKDIITHASMWASLGSVCIQKSEVK